MPGTIDFDSGKASLKMTEGTKKVLAAVVDIMTQNPQITTLSIEGNTDNAGEPKFDNMKLSQDAPGRVLDCPRQGGRRQGPPPRRGLRLDAPALPERHAGPHGAEPPRGVSHPRPER